MPVKTSSEKPWAKLRMSRKQYEAARMWKELKWSRERFDAFILSLPEEVIDHVHEEADAERLVEAIFGAAACSESSNESDLASPFSMRAAAIYDIPALKQLFRDTILFINSRDYSQEEVADWASCGEDDSRWEYLISSLHFVVAQYERSGLAGFASVSDAGYLHSMFIHKDFQRQGVATLLYKEVERYALEKRIRLLTSEVSITARPFFEKQGFAVEAEQKRKTNKLELTNYRMSRRLLSEQ